MSEFIQMKNSIIKTNEIIMINKYDHAANDTFALTLYLKNYQSYNSYYELSQDRDNDYEIIKNALIKNEEIKEDQNGTGKKDTEVQERSGRSKE